MGLIHANTTPSLIFGKPTYDPDPCGYLMMRDGIAENLEPNMWSVCRNIITFQISVSQLRNDPAW